jgi:hypothetical protein
MFSFMAALKTLVLPFGATTGRRIILDGVNGVIKVFNSSNAETISIDSAGVGSVNVGQGAILNVGDYVSVDSATNTMTFENVGNIQVGNYVSIADRMIEVRRLGFVAPPAALLAPDLVTLNSDIIYINPDLPTARTQINGTISFDGGATRFRIARGSSVLSPNASGDVNLGAAIATATGWATTIFATWVNGDGATRANMNTGKTTAGSGTSWNVRCWVANTGATITSGSVRLDWIALGY